MLLNLRAVLVLLLCAGLHAEEPEAELIEPRDDSLTQQLKDILACVLPKLVNGYENIPPLDPLRIDSIDINIDGGYLHFNTFVAKGIAGLDITYADLSFTGGLSNMAIVLNLEIPSLSLDTYYDADVTLFDTLHLYGKGNLSLAVADIAPAIAIELNLESFEIKQFDFNLDVGEVAFEITGLLNDEYMSQLISNMVKSIIEDNLNELIEIVISLLSSGTGDGGDLSGVIGDIIDILIKLLAECSPPETVESLKMEALRRR